MKPALVILIGALLAPAPLHADDRETVAREFAAALSQRAVPSEWARPAELVERNRVVALEVTGVRGDPAGDATILQVSTAGSLTPWGPRGRARDARLTWMLTLAQEGGRWTIASADRAEMVVARRLGAAAPAERAAILARHADLDVCRIARDLAEITRYNEPFAARVDVADAAIDLARARCDERTVILTMIPKIAAIQLSVGPAEAVAYAREVFAAAQKNGDPDVMASAQFMLGLRTGDAAMLQRAVALIDELEDPRIAIKAQTMVCNVFANSEDFAALAAEYDRLEALGRLYAWREGELNARIFRAQMQIRLGHAELGRRELEQVHAEALAEKNDYVAAVTADNLTHMVHESDGPARAVQMLVDAMPNVDRVMIPLQRARIRQVLAIYYGEIGCYAEGEAAIAEAIAIHPESAGAAERSRAEIRLMAGRYEDTLTSVRSAIAGLLANPNSEVDDLIASRMFAGAALRALGRDAEAKIELEQAIALIDATVDTLSTDALARATYLETRIQPQLDLIDLLVDRGQTREALELAERMRARALQEALREREIDLSASMSDEEKAKEESLDARVVEINRKIGSAGGAAAIEALRGELARARAELTVYRSELFLRHPDLRARRAATREVAVTAAAEPAIEYVVNEKRTVVFARDGNGGISAVVIPIAEAELRRRVQRFNAAVTGRDLAYGRDARELYDLLIRPVEAHLGAGLPLCIVPDGVLWRVPFQVLQDRGGRHLIESRPVYYATALTHAVRTQPARPRRVLAFGNPRLTASTVDRVRSIFRAETGSLPEAESEVRAIAALYGAGRSRVYVGEAAAEATFKKEAPAYSVLHVASHGMLDDAAPMFSALLFASEADASEDGLLEAREVLDLDLNADLAILSACETAGAVLGHGEGIIGLSWAFLAAGCPTTVVSQWKAQSKATERLMIAFHKSLVAGRTPATALQDAQRSLLRDRRYAHPLYWGTFMVLGAGP